MSRLIASGAATNAGIDFQQRVSAWFLAAMFLKLDISDIAGFYIPATIREIAFETSTPIDDLKLSCNELEIYLQIKRTIQLSTDSSTPFYKTIEQFFKQHLLGECEKEIYVLATSSDASSKVIRELKKITDSIRLNDEGFMQNPLNKSEKDTLQKYKTCLRRIHKKFTGKEITHDDFKSFSQKMYVSVFDIEQGMPLEKAVLLLLGTRVAINPSLIWANLIKSSLVYASKRLSINVVGLLQNYKKYLRSSDDSKLNEVSESDIANIIMENSSLAASGKEVLLVESPIGENSYLIAELSRFSEDCSKQLEFFDNRCLLADKKTTWTVLHRCSTLNGMIRFIEENLSLLNDKDVVIAPAKEIENVEATPCAMAYAELCLQVLQKNRVLLKCLHCGKAISEDKSLVVEIDDNHFNQTIGLVHKECLRSIDRVLGLMKSDFFENHSYLRRFDAGLWVKCLKDGQGAFSGLKNMKLQSVANMAWDSETECEIACDYCIKVSLEGNLFEYIKRRGKIQRFDESSAQQRAEAFNKGIERMKAQRNPYCYTSKNKVFGAYDTLLSQKDSDEELLECIRATPARYTELLGKIYNTNTNFYAPLCLVADLASGELFSLNDCVVFITDPLSLKNFLGNWEKAGIQIEDYELKIVATDMEFDTRVKATFQKGMGIIIDPLLDTNKNFVKGYNLVDINEMLKPAKEHQQMKGIH